MTQLQDKFFELWVAALNSGDYKQGFERLAKDEEYCCLGVACEVYNKMCDAGIANLTPEQKMPLGSNNVGEKTYDGEGAESPHMLNRMLGLQLNEEVVKITEEVVEMFKTNRSDYYIDSDDEEAERLAMIVSDFRVGFETNLANLNDSAALDFKDMALIIAANKEALTVQPVKRGEDETASESIH